VLNAGLTVASVAVMAVAVMAVAVMAVVAAGCSPRVVAVMVAA